MTKRLKNINTEIYTKPCEFGYARVESRNHMPSPKPIWINLSTSLTQHNPVNYPPWLREGRRTPVPYTDLTYRQELMDRESSPPKSIRLLSRHNLRLDESSEEIPPSACSSHLTSLVNYVGSCNAVFL